MPGPSQPTDGKPLILVAEDHVDSREALCALLQAFGYEVIQAMNGRDAVNQATSHAPDLILMDLMMPEVDGFEATRLLRSNPATHDIPIITVTALEGARRLAREAGADDFLSKPIDSTDLMKTLTLHLEDR